MDLNFTFKLFAIKRTISIRRQWVQFAIIATVVMASTIIAFWGSASIFMLILVLLIGTTAIMALMRQPNWGFIFIFLGGIFIPFTGPSGLNMATVMVALMLVLWIMDMLVVQRYFALIRSRVMIPTIVFLVIATVSFGMGQIPWFVFARQAPITAQAAGFAIVAFSVGGMLLSAHLIQNTGWLRLIVWIFLGLFAIYIISRVANLSFISNLYNQGFVAQSMSWTWVIALTFGQIIYNNKLSRRTRGTLIGLVVLTFYVAFVQGFEWKSGWVPPLVAVFVLLAIRYRKLTIIAIPFAVMLALYAAVHLIATDEYSWGTRTDAWKIILEISRVSPLLGMGFSNYYWYTPLFPIRGWHVSFNSHSQFVDLIAQTGYFGLISFLWLFFAIAQIP